jgi:hypothetical protein
MDGGRKGVGPPRANEHRPAGRVDDGPKEDADQVNCATTQPDRGASDDEALGSCAAVRPSGRHKKARPVVAATNKTNQMMLHACYGARPLMMVAMVVMIYSAIRGDSDRAFIEFGQDRDGAIEPERCCRQDGGDDERHGGARAGGSIAKVATNRPLTIIIRPSVWDVCVCSPLRAHHH